MKKKWKLRHCDLDLWPTVTNFNRVRASVLSKRLVKTASKSVHPFGWNFVHKKCRTHRQTDRQTDTHTDTQTNCNENITPPRFRGGVIIHCLCGEEISVFKSTLSHSFKVSLTKLLYDRYLVTKEFRHT